MCVLFRMLPWAGDAAFIYAEVLAAHLDTRTEFVVTAERDAHGSELSFVAAEWMP